MIYSLWRNILVKADDILDFGEIYSSKSDDMPLLSQWIKKFDKSKPVEFFGLPDRI